MRTKSLVIAVARLRVRLLLCCALAGLFLAVTACGGDSDPAVNARNDVASDTGLPTLDGADGRLLFVQGDTLYVGALDGFEAQPVAEGIDPWRIYPAPNSSTVAYVTEDGRLVAADLDAQSAVDLFSSEDGALSVFGWSPDGRWLAFTWISPVTPAMPLTPEQKTLFERGGFRASLSAAGVYPASSLVIAGPDGTAYASEAYPIAAEWLEDNRLLALAERLGEQFAEGATLILLDPVAQDEQVVHYTGPDYTIAQGMETFEHRAEFQRYLEASGLALAPPTDERYMGAAALSPEKDAFVTFTAANAPSGALSGGCGSFAIVRKPVMRVMLPDIIYQTSTTNVTGLGGLEWLPGDSILFTLYTSETCDPTGARGALYHLSASGEAQAITDQLAATHGQNYAPSPDGRYVAWSGFDAETNTSFLALTELATGATTRLLSSDASEQAFHAVHWMP